MPKGRAQKPCLFYCRAGGPLVAISAPRAGGFGNTENSSSPSICLARRKLLTHRNIACIFYGYERKYAEDAIR
jgi:hypothetical protein